MNIALQQAEVAERNGEVPVGAVLLLKDGREFAAHNAPISLNDSTAHAEMRAIRIACEAVENYRLIGSTLYVTLEPCAMCAGAIIHARISRVVYGARDAKTGAVKSLYQLLSDTRLNHQPEVSSGVMDRECSTILRDFFYQRRNST
ncbi:MAG: tRNA adenosine(34) deaminase TadA [Zetaproteobacteria bacterium]|nr:MAG: tRNA adenosine(34) deaminase TadA [Zetaproteobacteria bacterium]